MSWHQALLLALLQGITEFLPISSSAHLILLPWLVGWQDQGLAFDVAVNTGTLLAVALYFRRDLVAVTAGFLRGLRQPRLGIGGDADGRLGWALVLGTVPVAVAGLLADDWIATGARDPRLIAGTTIGFGLLLGAADLLGRRRRELAELAYHDALWIGLAQALALVPGTSRSGITITAALFLGFSRPAAARFSFLLAVPVGVLAAGHDLLQLATGRLSAGELPAMALGMAAAAVSAYLVIAWLLAFVRRHSLLAFAGYRLALGALILFWLAARG